MLYIQSTLLKNEKLLFWSRPHWIIFTPSVITVILSFVLLSYGRILPMAYYGIFGIAFYKLLALLVFLYGAYRFAGAYIYLLTSEYGVTNRRVLMKTGWISRNSVEVFVEKIEAIRVDQTVVGRLLNYGTILVIGTGGTTDPMFYIPDPLNFRKKVQEQINRTDLNERS